MTDITSADLDKLEKAARASFDAITSKAQLEEWRVLFLGRKGKIPQLLRKIKDLPESKRRHIGQQANQIRQHLEALLAEQKAVYVKEQDIDRPPVQNMRETSGHIHPLTTSLRKAQRIFADMGFLIVEGPHVEEARYNFDNLNISLEHPARAETDTYYLEDHPDLVLRTHVSTLQSRAVIEHDLRPPFKIMYYGGSYRAEKEDATHGAVFQQYEFMVVDKHVTLADLKAIVTNFYSRFFETQATIRFRPSYFPFVEPGLEVDMQDTVTSKGGWLEMAGAGMVHPNVLKAINVDPNVHQGIALGGGLDRLAMLKYNIPDIRLFYSGDLHFLRQF